MQGDMDKTTQHRWVCFCVIGFLALLGASPLIHVGYTTNDETHIYYYFPYALPHFLVELGSSFKVSVLGLLHGFRPSLPALFTSPVFSMISAAANWPGRMRALSLLVHALNLFLFYRLAMVIFRSWGIAVLVVVVFLTLIQNSWDHNLLTGNTVQAAGFSLVLAAFLLFYSHFGTLKRSRLYLSAAVYFFALSYETNLVYFPLFFVIAAKEIGRYRREISFIWEKCRPVSLLVAVYLGAYFGMRYLLHFGTPVDFRVLGLSGMENNGGYNISIGFAKLPAIARVIAGTAIAAFPGFRYFFNHNFIAEYCAAPWGGPLDIIGLVKNIQALWFVKAVLAGGTVYALLRTIMVKAGVSLPALFLVAVYLTFAPGLPVSLVEKYQYMAKIGSVGMINTYHSFFGITFGLVTFVLWLNKRLAGDGNGWRRRMLVVIVPVLIAVFSILTDFSNHSYAVSQVQSQKKWESMDAFIASPAFKAIPPGSVIYAPSLFGQIGIMGIFPPYWTDYVEYKTGGTSNILDNPALIREYVRNPRIIFKNAGHEKIRIAGTRAELKELVSLDNPANLYYLQYGQEKKAPNQYIVFGKVRRVKASRAKLKFYGDDFYLYDFTKYRQIFLSGAVDGISGGKSLEITNGNNTRFRGDVFALPLVAEEKPGILGAKVKGVRLESVSVSGSPPSNTLVKPISLEFGEGAYSEEGEYRWCQRNCAVYVSNDSAEPQNVQFHAIFSTTDQPPSRLEVVGDSFHEDIVISTVTVGYSRSFRVMGNSDFKISFKSSAKRLDTPGDPRSLYFKIANASVNLNSGTAMQNSGRYRQFTDFSPTH